ncbi:branched-chain amino acid ABC transporter permease [Pandoraea anhela]|uniref:ABC transporter ATP-binding protein n=1 Tax=Pandoraea anhela TaxID=2508295 RepID=A0A5E4X3U9_9BURK|nr:branched-chain amino acid ABC transporter permease [Pandoraea anhela]VVE30974.1 ABC transporter ATP-binding protein [Pandoraea anhela]
MGAYETALVILIGVHIVLAVSLNLISGLCGQVSLGHAAFFGIGAYTTAVLSKLGFAIWVTLPASMTFAGICGAIVGFCSLRVRDDFLAIATMAAGFLFLGIVRTSEALGGELGLSRIPDAGFGDGFVYFVIVCTALVVGFCVYIKRSWLGYAFSAVGADEIASRSIGINSADFKLTAFGIGTALAGVAGCLYAYFLGTVDPQSFGFPVSIMILAMVVIGGMGSIGGSVLAAVLLTLLPEWLRFVSSYKLLVFGGLLFVMMRFLPRGIAPCLRLDAWRLRTGRAA